MSNKIEKQSESCCINKNKFLESSSKYKVIQQKIPARMESY